MCKYCYSNVRAIYGKTMSCYEEPWKCQCSFNSGNLPFMHRGECLLFSGHLLAVLISVILPSIIQINARRRVSLVKIQLFRQRLSHKSVKAYATMPIGIMGSKVRLCLIEFQGDSATRMEKA